MKKNGWKTMGFCVWIVWAFLSETHALAASRDTPYYWAWWGWEPLEHNVRLGGPSASVDGSAWWASAWYDRLHGEALARGAQILIQGVDPGMAFRGAEFLLIIGHRAGESGDFVMAGCSLLEGDGSVHAASLLVFR